MPQGSAVTDTRPVVLCADDYALSEGVSRGILELARQGRISATSAMTNMPLWPAHAPALAEIADRIAAGLHLNLTTGFPLGAMPNLAPDGRLPPLESLIRQALTGGLPIREIEAEIERQLDAFGRSFGTGPAFVDGHQHVHGLPGIRTALLAVLGKRGLAGRLWLRDPSDRVSSILRRGLARKALAVTMLTAGFRAAAVRAGFETNEGFSGFSPLAADTAARQVFDRAFRALGPRPVVMCHPGYVDETLRDLDPAVESRLSERAYLASESFAALLAERSIRLVPEPEPMRS
jgi:predicted glycoside hydrolase/deacetylase ChbG (UPF0249 family)